MKHLNLKYYYYTIIILFCCSCHNDSIVDTKEYLLSKILYHYRYIDKNEFKEDATKFLIENMPFHYSQGHVTKESTELKNWIKATDSVFYSTTKTYKDSDNLAERIQDIQNNWKKKYDRSSIREHEIEEYINYDYNILTPDFLIEHIDNAFTVWHTTDASKNLSFENFKEYILPYRAVNSVGYSETGKHLKAMFNKYIWNKNVVNAKHAIDNYNKAIYALRDMNGKMNFKHHNGIADIFSRDYCDCIDMANWGALTLRACGIPTVVEYNICYRSLPGRHYFCSIYNTSDGTWSSFNPESSIPGEKDWAFAETANVYRITYAPQQDTPYYLRAKEEFIPTNLSDPCIKDVTNYLCKTSSITLPAKISSNNNLVYLATFSKENNGIVPVTWSTVNHKTQKAHFQHILANMIYFPIYYPSEKWEAFGMPFYVDSMNNICEIPYTNKNDSLTCDATFTRKYPRKPNMIDVAHNLVGSMILGANTEDFSDADILLTITKPLQPYLQNLKLSKTGKYQYYRFCAPAEHPNANISMLEWISNTKYGYTNIEKPSRCAIVDPADTLKPSTKSVKLLDASSWAEMATKAEYDGNMLTAPGAYPYITLRLKEPQIVESIQLAPLNADNGIKSQNIYELYYWDNGWQSLGTKMADYEFIKYNNIPTGKLYWLKNLSQGEEEMPFVLSNGKQIFFYSDIVPLSKP